jgi:hypothetical protein
MEVRVSARGCGFGWLAVEEGEACGCAAGNGPAGACAHRESGMMSAATTRMTKVRKMDELGDFMSAPCQCL